MSFPVSAAHRCRRRGRRPVSDLIGELSDRLPSAALCGVSGATRNLPLLRQHLQLLADQGGVTGRLRKQLGLHADGSLAAEGQHRQVQRVHETMTKRGKMRASSSQPGGRMRSLFVGL